MRARTGLEAVRVIAWQIWLCPENWSVPKLKSGGLICLAEEIFRQSNHVQPAAWLLLIALIQVDSEKKPQLE